MSWAGSRDRSNYGGLSQIVALIEIGFVCSAPGALYVVSQVAIDDGSAGIILQNHAERLVVHDQAAVEFSAALAADGRAGFAVIDDPAAVKRSPAAGKNGHAA